MLLSLQTFIVFSSLAVDGMCTDAMLQATAALTSLSSRTVPFLPQDALVKIFCHSQRERNFSSLNRKEFHGQIPHKSYVSCTSGSTWGAL